MKHRFQIYIKTLAAVWEEFGKGLGLGLWSMEIEGSE